MDPNHLWRPVEQRKVESFDLMESNQIGRVEVVSGYYPQFALQGNVAEDNLAKHGPHHSSLEKAFVLL